ncbi:hypothetical protein NFI96_008126 [Prochilodus magdalenae]|nr:hypothetical protein NFI96_008126 [Prochilodus magdalenae]
MLFIPVENPMKMTMTETAINPPSLTDGGQVSDLLLEVVLEVGFPSTTIQPLEVSESYFVFKTRMTSELLKLALEDLVQPPNPENTVGHSEEEPLDALVSPAEITPVGELLGVQREENPLESVQPLDDPWSTAEDMQDIGKLLLMILLEDTSGSVQALPQKERVLSNIIAALQQNFEEAEEEPAPLEKPLDGLVSSSDLRDQLVRELLDIQRELTPSECVQPLGVEKEKLPEVDPEKTTTASHSLQYFYTEFTPGINFPEFTSVGQVDGEQIDYYDSDIRMLISKTDWMKEFDAEDYWDRQTQGLQGQQEIFKVNLGILMDRFNQTEGLHTVQLMYGCELDSRTGPRRGSWQYGYDGEDFISLDVNTETWTAANAKAVITKRKWEQIAWAGQVKNYLENECIEWLEKYVGYGRSTLERRVHPEVSLFQRDPSSPVMCHATGFFPKPVNITWQKNGEDLYEGVELRETLPNQDGTFQRRSILTVPPEELDRNYYTCIIQHSSLEKDMVLQVFDLRVLTGGRGEGKCFRWRVSIVSTAVVVSVLIGCVGVVRKSADVFTLSLAIAAVAFTVLSAVLILILFYWRSRNLHRVGKVPSSRIDIIDSVLPPCSLNKKVNTQ